MILGGRNRAHQGRNKTFSAGLRSERRKTPEPGFEGGFNRSTQRFVDTVQPAFRNLASFWGARSFVWPRH
jgi:hypothetical protein